MSTPFTLQDGLEMQNRHMDKWKQRLNDACYNALLAHIQNKNFDIAGVDGMTGYDVTRGDQLYEFVANWKP